VQTPCHDTGRDRGARYLATTSLHPADCAASARCTATASRRCCATTKLPQTIITPTTKAEQGHTTPLSADDIVARKL
jgi:phosphoribosylaminoimidazole-succinocarboxamide synthase